MRRIGIYGGSFDPIHIGHLAIAEDARYALDLVQVVFIPAARQPLKSDAQVTSGVHRLAMTRLACQSNSAFKVSDIELRRPPPSYTVDTLTALRAEFAGASELVFILGADAARDLHRWYRAAEIPHLAHLAIVGRPGYGVDLAALTTALPGLAGRYTLIDGPHLEVSSSDLRLRLAAGRPTRYQIPDPVLAHIAEHELYRH
jgi:nicotinate-nucleotide adenylyltransferase